MTSATSAVTCSSGTNFPRRRRWRVECSAFISSRLAYGRTRAGAGNTLTTALYPTSDGGVTDDPSGSAVSAGSWAVGSGILHPLDRVPEGLADRPQLL